MWEYDNTDEHYCGFNPPRERLALAVSRDGTRTWQYVMDLDDWEGHRYRHMNGGMEIFDGEVWAFSPRRNDNGSDFHPQSHDFYLWRIAIDRMEPTHTFPGTHGAPQSEWDCADRQETVEAACGGAT